MNKIAVVLTCHNRKDKTIQCLETLRVSFEQIKRDYLLRVFICNDGSTDGTGKALHEYTGLQLQIIDGDGNLFWAKGMARAMSIAESFDPDIYILVNDDVWFFDNMFTIMINSFIERNNNMSAIVGSTLNNEKCECSYGGFCWDNNGIILKINYRRVLPTDDNRACKWANWNCFLIHKELYNAIGKIDDFYEHSFADYDYSNRIIKQGYSMFVANDYVGICERNSLKGTYLDNSLTIRKRLALLNTRIARPISSSWYYAKKFYGVFAVFYFLKPYLYIFITAFPLTRLIIHKVKNY